MMELSEDSSPKSNTFPCALPGPAAAEIKAENTVQSSASTSQSLPITTQHGRDRRFVIRSAKERSLSKGTNTVHDRSRLLSLNENKAINMASEENQGKHTEGQPGKETHQPSITTRDDLDEHSRTAVDQLSNLLNEDKLTKDSKLKVGLNTKGSQELGKPERCHSEDDTKQDPLRGRVELRNGNVPTRSRSVDRGGELSNDEVMAKGQSFQKSSNMRRTESLDRETRLTTKVPVSPLDKFGPARNGVLSRINSYNVPGKTAENKPRVGLSATGRTHGLMYFQKGKGCQSFPSRIKLTQSGSGEAKDSVRPSQDDPWVGQLRFKPGLGAIEPEARTKRIGGLSANQSIWNRIEKLYGSNSLGMDTKQGKVDCYSEPVGDYLQHTKQGNEEYDSCRRSGADIQWRAMPYKGPRGGTFPRSHSVEEKFTSGHGNMCHDRKNLSILNQGISPVVEWPKGCCSVGDQTPLTEITAGDLRHQFRSRDKTQGNPYVLLQPRLFRTNAGNVSLSGRSSPMQRPSRLVKDKGEEGRELEMEKDRVQDEHEMGILKKSKEADMIQDKVHNVDQQNDRERKPGGKVEKDKQWVEESNMLSKSMKALTVVQRSPTVKFCVTMDWPLQASQSLSQEAASATKRLNKEAKKDPVNNPCGEVETIQPAGKSLVLENAGEGEEEYSVFKMNSLAKDQRKMNPAKLGADFSNNVRNKIRRFETLAQNSQTTLLPLLRSRRAFSEQDPPRELYGGWEKKGGSDKALGGMGDCGLQIFNDKLYSKGEGESNAEVDGVKWCVRSFSIDEVGQRRWDRRKVYGNKCGDFKPGTGLHRASIEQHSLKICHIDIEGAVSSQEISQHLNTKQATALHKTDWNNSSSGQNVYNSSNSSSVEGKAPSSPNRSTFVHASNVTTSCTNQVSSTMMEPPGSVSTQKNITGAQSPPSSHLLPSSVLAPPASKPEPSNTISSSDPVLQTEESPVEREGTCSSVRMARWSSDEEESNGEDDDSSTEKEENSNYDSDSAASSVTITSNMSQSDHRSFSITLADLCHVGGVDCGCHDDSFLDVDSLDCTSRRTASLSSNASALSCVSILGADELDRLLSDVRSLGDETLQNYEDVQVVVLHKEVGCGLGFTLAGGIDQNKPITVHRVFSGSVAAQEGSIHEGDRVLSINGTKLQTSAHWEALRTLRRARSRGMAVVVLQKDSLAKSQKVQNNPSLGQLDLVTVNTRGRTLRVVLNKCSTDLGFSLEGGLGSSQGDRPILVKKVFQGGPVNEVFPGDELLEIKGHSLQGLHRLEAWNLIKKLPPGPVEVILNRPL